MIVLDTNVVSEMMKPEPHPAVRKWLNDQVAETLYLSTVTLAELRSCIGALPDGRRKRGLSSVLDEAVQLFGDRLLTFDADAACRYAELAVKARASGNRFPAPEGYIAAIAASKGFAVATRDAAPFQVVGLTVITPWDHA